MSLFHGSPGERTIIEPRESTNTHISQSAFVFAHPSELYAHAYALKNAAAFTAQIINNWCYTVITPEQRMAGPKYGWEDNLTRRKEGLGGFIHEFSSHGFREIPATGEWVSPNSVIPEKRRFVTIDDCMRAGVQIFRVVDPKIYSWKSQMWAEDPIAFIKQGIEDNGLRWLNRENLINPLPLPLINGVPAKPAGRPFKL